MLWPDASDVDSFTESLLTLSLAGAPEGSYYVQDHLGNSRIVYKPVFCGVENASGEPIEYDVEYVGDYFPYAKTIREYVKGKKEKFLSTEHERDEETGLDYRGARFYDADIGRFLSLDPLAASFSDVSAYNYVLGNPLSLIDPTGRAPVYIDGIEAGADEVRALGRGTYDYGQNDGANDYFDESGNFVGSGGNGNEVRIVDGAVKKGANLSSTILSKHTFSSKDAVSKIGQHYFNNYIGCNEVSVCGKVNASFTEMAVTIKSGYISEKEGLISTRSQPIIGISVSGYGSVSSLLDNRYNFINILAHEFDHFQKIGFDGTNYSWYTTNIGSGNTAISRHLNTYLTQQQHWSFKNINSALKKDFRNSVNNYINALDDPLLQNQWRGYFKF